MKRKITVLSSLVICVAVLMTIIGFGADNIKTDTTMVAIDVQYAKETSATTNAIGGLIENVAGGNVIGDALNGAGQNLGSALEGVTGNLSDAAGNLGGALGSVGNGGGLAGVVDGIGDAIDGIGGALSSLTTTTPATTELGTITPVPAVSQHDTQVVNPIVTQNTTTTTDENIGETVDYSATYNPYKKPAIELKAGEKDNSVKWVQWIFIYTHYGLKEDGITGVLDDDTVHLIKKFQAEKGLPVNGNMTKDFIDSLELYFYECTFGTNTTTAAPLTQSTQMESTTDVDSGEKNSNLPILIVLLVLIWVLAIVAIIVLVIYLKKKKSIAKNADAPVSAKTEAENIQKQETSKENETEKKQKTLEELFDEDNK